MSETTEKQNAGGGPPLLDLSAERKVLLKFGRDRAWHVFRRITEPEWVKFEQQSAGTITRQGDNLSIQDAAQEATLAFWERNVLRVEGYRTGEDWKERMHPYHCIHAVALLQEVYVVGMGSPLDLSGELRTVELEASWNGEVFRPLVHRFHPARKEHLLKYKRMPLNYLQVRGARKPTTRVQVPANTATLCELYDELIAEVEGYTGWQRAQEMDAVHKQWAVSALLDPKTTADSLVAETEDAA